MNRILIVDPNPVALKQLNMQLTAEGFETMIFEKAPDALQAAERFMPDVIMSEVDMPETNGFQFLESIRKIERLIKIPFVFCSYQADTNTKIRAFESTADEFIAKPFEFRDLLVRLNLQIKLRKDPNFSGDNLNSGELRQKPLRSVFDSIHARRQSGLLRIVHNGETSFVGFKDGEIVYSKSINRIGKQAIYYLFSLQGGKFKFDEGDKLPVRNVLDSYALLNTYGEKVNEITSKLFPRYYSTTRIKYVDPELIMQLAASTDLKDSNLAKLLETCHTVHKVVNYTEYGVLEVLRLMQGFIADKQLVIENAELGNKQV